VLLICLVRRNATFSLPRALQAAVSSIGVLLAVGIQLFLMREVFPHAGYGSTKVVQIVHNLKNVAGWPPFFLFMLPVFWTLWRILKKKSHITDPDAALALGACIFACMWSIVGIVQEVRIFFPYALVLAPLTICLLMQATLSKPTVRSN